MVKFEISDDNVKKFDKWRKSKKDLPPSSDGGAYQFCFTPTGLGQVIIVKCVDGTELDLTDYSRW